MSCPAARAVVVAQPELPWTGCGDGEARQGLARQAAPTRLPAATAQNPLLKTMSSPPAWSCGQVWAGKGFSMGSEFGCRSGFSPRRASLCGRYHLLGGRAQLTGAIPAQLRLPSSQPRAAPALLPSPGGRLSLGSGRCLLPPALILPEHPPAMLVNERRPRCPPGPDSPSQSSRPNHPAGRRQVPPRTSRRPRCDSVPACRRRPAPSPPSQHHPGRTAVASWGAGQRRGGKPDPGHGAGEAGHGPGRCVAPAWCSRNLPIRMGKRQVPSSHPGNRGKTRHDWPDRLGNSRKETTWPLCHGLEPLLWGEAPGRARGCSPAELLSRELASPLPREPAVLTGALRRAGKCYRGHLHTYACGAGGQTHTLTPRAPCSAQHAPPNTLCVHQHPPYAHARLHTPSGGVVRWGLACSPW